MSYVTIYCNEQMLLDNWEYYNESNRKLRNVLKKTDMTANECAEFYLSHMHNREFVQYSFEDLVERFRRQNIKSRILKLESIPIYQGDIDYIRQANDKYGLSIIEMRSLFAVIFLCRMYDSDIAKLDNKRRIWGITGVYAEYLPFDYISNDRQWYDVYNTISGLGREADELHLLERIPTNGIGCYYRYLNFDKAKKTKIIYTYNVTLESNRLTLSNVFKELVPYKDCHCLLCGRKMTAISNSNKYCEECAKSRIVYRKVILNNLKTK